MLKARKIKISQIFLIAGISALLLAGCKYLGLPPAVPVAPNDSLVTAKVLDHAIDTTSGQTLYILIIEILSSEDVAGMPNFTKDKVGQSIKVYSKLEFSADLVGKTIRANVSLVGDERGGKYWIANIEVIF